MATATAATVAAMMMDPNPLRNDIHEVLAKFIIYVYSWLIWSFTKNDRKTKKKNNNFNGKLSTTMAIAMAIE